MAQTLEGVEYGGAFAAIWKRASAPRSGQVSLIHFPFVVVASRCFQMRVERKTSYGTTTIKKKKDKAFGRTAGPGN